MKYIETNDNYPMVLKADGLAAGKGVIICNTADEAKNAINDILIHNKFGISSGIIID